ncbi:alpha/beta fold hydrolase [Neisseria chenwenguii]|uniref:alpha/beta fold hydrolase n=1 Tax=Neisseria chenwenguii TaxID=1853278 RepID=UPI0013152F16|nr:alpha/beta hydrolase [Neisseria chenwenguii]
MKIPFLILVSTVLLTASPVRAETVRYFGQTAQSYQSTVPYGNNPASGRYADADDTKIYYETYGTGKPVVVLHGGIVGSIAEMGQLIDRLAENRRVIAVSTRGHGKSAAGTVPPGYPRKAADVAAVLKQENISEPVDLIGFSDGAYTAYHFAAAYPEKTGKTVAIGAGVWKRGWRSFDMTLADLQKTDAAYWAQQMKIRPRANRTGQWLRQTTAYYNGVEVNTDLFAKIRTPVLLLAGEKDANAPLDTVIAAYKALPDARLGIIAGQPHSVLQSNFAAAWAMIKPFLSER